MAIYNRIGMVISFKIRQPNAAKPLKRGTFNDYPEREYTQVSGNSNTLMVRYSLIFTEM